MTTITCVLKQHAPRELKIKCVEPAVIPNASPIVLVKKKVGLMCGLSKY